jgi:hypothetical protein
VTARAREAIDEVFGVRAVPERQRGQVHRRRPALRALDQPRHPVIRQAHAGGGQQRTCFGVAQRQLRRAQLRKPPVRPPAGQRPRGIRPRREGELAAHRQPLAEIADHGVTAGLGHQVNVVEHQHERLVGLGARIDERRQHDVLERRLGDEESSADRVLEIQDRIERGEHARDERDRVVVGGIEGNPRKEPLVALAPERQQRGLAIAGGRRDEHDRRMGRGHQAVEERGAIDDARSQRRGGQLGRDDATALDRFAGARRVSGAIGPA